MDQKSLMAFVVLAEELQFGRAAQRLKLTQSAVSQQIARLEKELGVTLFERTKRKVALSESGSVFLPDAQKVIRDIEQATETAQRAAKGLLGKIRIGYVDAAPFSILSPLVMQFRKSWPEVGMVLYELTSLEQFDALKNGKIDIGLLRPIYKSDEINTITLVSEPYVVAMNKEHQFAELNEIPIHVLAGEKFLFTSKEKAKYIFSNWSVIFSRYGISPDIVQEVNQLHAMLSLVGAGMGIALLPASVAENNNHGVVYRALTGIDVPNAELNIAWLKDNKNIQISHFVNMAKEVNG